MAAQFYSTYYVEFFLKIDFELNETRSVVDKCYHHSMDDSEIYIGCVCRRNATSQSPDLSSMATAASVSPGLQP